MRLIETLRVGEVILTEVDGEDMPATITSIDGDNESVKVNIVGTAIKSELYTDQVFKIDRKSSPWNKNDVFPSINQNMEDPDNTFNNLDKYFLVKVGVEHAYTYELARYNEWGWHYATRNTQDTIQDVFEWKELDIR